MVGAVTVADEASDTAVTALNYLMTQNVRSQSLMTSAL